MPITITSPSNNRIKEVIRLAKRQARDERRVTLVEGTRECRHALAAGIVPVEAYVCHALLDEQGRALLPQLIKLDAQRQTWLAEVTPELFAKLAYRGDSGGILLVIPYLAHSLERFIPTLPAFLAVIEGVEKPGNLGAILRTADAAGVQGVIVTEGATDIHNPNVVRASLGALFTLPVIESPTDATIEWLRHHGIQIVAATPEGTRRYTQVDYARPTAVVMGSEAYGLSDSWRDAADHLVTIPMVGHVDSLNLATSTAIMLYEVVRQRIPTSARHP